MDFFARQEDSEARSRRFYRTFGLSVAVAVVVFYLAITGCFLVVAAGLGPLLYSPDPVSLMPGFIYGTPPRLFGLRPILVLTVFILAVILLASFFKTSAIKKGGGAYIAEAMGGELIQAPRSEAEKRLVNVVEEMAVASGLPRPRVYIMPKERGINAVTAGLDHEDAIVAVTKGSLDHLSRDELQGVIAHEFAHILNGDYALNLTMAGWLYGLLFFYVQGRDMMAMAGEMQDKGETEGDPTSVLSFIAVPTYAVGLVLCVGGWLGKALAEMLQAAFSREREFLADSFAVQFTRNPVGLAGALKKIAGSTGRSAMANTQALMMRSFFIVSPSRADGLFSSHPPLADRIQALDPAWDGTPVPIDLSKEPLKDDVPRLRVRERAGLENTPNKSRRQVLDFLDGGLARLPRDWTGVLLLGLLASGGGRGGRSGPGMLGQDNAAFLMGQSLENASRLYGEIHEKIREAADDPVQVGTLTAAVFLSDQPDVRAAQGGLIRQLFGEEAENLALKLRSLISEEQRLPILGLAAPTFREVSRDGRQLLAKTVKALVAADGKLDLFEIAACQVLKKHLGLSLTPPSSPKDLGHFVEQVRQDVVTVLSILAYLGAPGEEEARAAFCAGMVYFTQWPAYDLAPREVTTSRELVRSLDRLSQAPDKTKNALIMGAVTVALHDHQINRKEYELLRALAAALDIPLPLLKMNS